MVENAGKIAGAISAIVAVISLLLIKPIKKARAAQREERQKQDRFQRDVLERLNLITDDIAQLQCERLSQAHDYYTSRGWCPTSKKQQLCEMYKSYRSKGRNHLAEHYEDDIMHLAEKPA